jgi:hypothetical protein
MTDSRVTFKSAVALAVMAATLAIAGPATSAARATEVDSPHGKEVDALDQRRSDAEIFMEVDASRSEIAGVGDAIAVDDDVERYAYLDHRTALAEFRRIFRRNRQLRDGVLARDLPVSYRLVVRPGTLDDVRQRYASMAGVDIVMDGSSNETNAWSARVACSRTAYDLEVFMADSATPDQVDGVAKIARRSRLVDGVEVADAKEVNAIFECLRGRNGGRRPALPPVIVHVDVDDPADPAFEGLRSALVAAPGVDMVNSNPSVGAGT